MNQATKEFIEKNANKDVKSLALKKTSSKDIDLALAIRQIEGMQKVKNKIPTFFHCPTLFYPPKLSLEQSSSEITAKYKSTHCKGTKIVDLTGGFGIDCFFLSGNFNESVYIEKQKELCDLAEHNFKQLGSKNIKIINTAAEDFLLTEFTSDWIYLDPARRKESGAKAVLLSDCEPNVAELQEKLLEKAENVMIKLSPMFDLSQLQRELKNIREIHIIAVENECKEILVILKRNYNESIQIKNVHFPKNKSQEVFEFTEDEEKKCVSNFANDVKKYLYEPNAAILKSGAFKIIGEKHSFYKLHINSHLYNSDELKRNFQGRIFEVKETLIFNKENIRKLKIEKANISVRNFPLSVDELRKKLKIKEGGDKYIFATTLQNDKKVLLICTKVNL
ncbi:conserved hypothetical protein [uncultured Paludibacter sp.]|uniref:Uncharacterized protein n=1 Tax=uncultured Paludibacter sp. TaxID=497635 RepID=A0A653A8B6_9BACT|nr:conserved hypothetical protein [uncultured Paludibacter sp.]